MRTIQIHFETIDSTNTWVKHHAAELDSTALTIVTAGEQTAGRGRFKRYWVSPPGSNIYATFAFFLEKHRRDVGNLPQVLAVSCCQVLENLNFQPALKWPNDVLLSGKKVAGILCETTPLSDHLCVALGIGLNVNMEPLILNRIDRPATSLFAEDGSIRKVGDVLDLLKFFFVKNLDKFINDGFHLFLTEYQNRLIHKIGDLIRFDDNRMVWEGTYQDLTPEGALNLYIPAKKSIKTFHAGEII